MRQTELGSCQSPFEGHHGVAVNEIDPFVSQKGNEAGYPLLEAVVLCEEMLWWPVRCRNPPGYGKHPHVEILGAKLVGERARCGHDNQLLPELRIEGRSESRKGSLSAAAPGRVGDQGDA